MKIKHNGKQKWLYFSRSIKVGFRKLFLFHPYILFSKSSLACLPVYGWEVGTCLHHYGQNLVVRNEVLTIAEG